MEVPMNTNPWFLERMADYEQDRIQRDIQQIRLEKEAMQAAPIEEKANRTGLPLYGLLMSIVSTLVRLWPFQVYTRKTLGFSGNTWPCHR
jgi:hypothetical protein